MTVDVSLGEIIASLRARGFAKDEATFEDAMVQVMAVDEELGEVARYLRRVAQNRQMPDPVKLREEAADVVIAAVCLLYNIAGLEAAAAISEKLQRDAARGYLHAGADGNHHVA